MMDKKVLCLVHKPTGQKYSLLQYDNFYGCDAFGHDGLSKFIHNIALFSGKLRMNDFSLQIMEISSKNAGYGLMPDE